MNAVDEVRARKNSGSRPSQQQPPFLGFPERVPGRRRIASFPMSCRPPGTRSFLAQFIKHEAYLGPYPVSTNDHEAMHKTILDDLQRRAELQVFEKQQRFNDLAKEATESLQASKDSNSVLLEAINDDELPPGAFREGNGETTIVVDDDESDEEPEPATEPRSKKQRVSKVGGRKGRKPDASCRKAPVKKGRK